MAFRYDFSDELEEVMPKIFRKDRKRYDIFLKKVAEIASRNNSTIDYYKNLRHDLKEYKRVHLDKSFVLIFKVFKQENFILFDKLKHHGEVYKK